ncbi:NtaA/DmoA family FMN-dependent monooxygenase [Pigmentiphaga aceris]|uniref:NtaA/DmoA family FMN-dependent monooxygenase n=1 Tax=Pigmentiphaga aceris TaxID=1940612 RepID=A0A5C0AV22_9BURK|nr:NtaA/DmoA family FMN-dependent monooxygenase [Pigmentiphaga aceris]QEI04521.1 NtaA/DmoA family FMN-dependent monooxygenase [Pigmentiphaga aceris]
MSTVHPQLTLSAFLYPVGQHITATQRDAGRSSDFEHYRQLAATAEKGLFDFLFLSDAHGVRPHDEEIFGHHSKGFATQFEPFTLLSALAACTERIGLVATASTSFNEPYHVARKVASLDHLSAGRAGWNVTVAQEAFEIDNFGDARGLTRAMRDARASEFVDVVTGLWNGASPLRHRGDGAPSLPYTGPERRAALDHRGTHFSVRGPLNISRPPQARPVLAKGVASGAAYALALRVADIVFTPQSVLSEARDFYTDFKDQARELGRDPGHIRILPDVFAVVGRTEAEARARFASLQPPVDSADSVSLLAYCLDANRRGYPLDGPLPPASDPDGLSSSAHALAEQARLDQMTIRETYLWIAGARGHWTLVGTPMAIADALEQWFRDKAADGFNLVPPDLPDSLGDFVELVVPELQRRGLFRTRYTGTTLRDHLGLPQGATG